MSEGDDRTEERSLAAEKPEGGVEGARGGEGKAADKNSAEDGVERAGGGKGLAADGDGA